MVFFIFGNVELHMAIFYMRGESYDAELALSGDAGCTASTIYGLRCLHAGMRDVLHRQDYSTHFAEDYIHIGTFRQEV